MTKRQDRFDKRRKKQEQLIFRTAHIATCTPEEASSLLRQPLVQSVRINPLKGSASQTLQTMHELGWKGSTSWCVNCYSIEEGFTALRDSQLVKKGRIYIQNEASWLPVVALNPQIGDTILDICAAPGGKTSHIAVYTQNSGKLVANDNSRARLMKLQANLERLGVQAEYTLCDATRLSKNTTELFDRILLDAPCSGEGLINLDDPKTLDSWSVAHIRRLASLQKQLIHQAWEHLKPGGRLVYSTCTMAPEENEAVIDWLLRRNIDAKVVPITVGIKNTNTPILYWNDRHYDPRIKDALRLLPAVGREAFFTCVIEKSPKSEAMA